MRLAQWASVRFASFNLLWMILDGAFAGFAAATTAEHDAARTVRTVPSPYPRPRQPTHPTVVQCDEAVHVLGPSSRQTLHLLNMKKLSIS